MGDVGSPLSGAENGRKGQTESSGTAPQKRQEVQGAQSVGPHFFSRINVEKSCFYLQIKTVETCYILRVEGTSRLRALVG